MDFSAAEKDSVVKLHVLVRLLSGMSLSRFGELWPTGHCMMGYASYWRTCFMYFYDLRWASSSSLPLPKKVCFSSKLQPTQPIIPLG